MEGQVRKYGYQHQQLSPERAVIWKERSPKYLQRQPEPVSVSEAVPVLQPKSQKVPVVYYLCKNRQLEHPHFIEVPLSSSEGLFLRDVIEKLNVLRGSGMASMYSWSCKRSYKNGFVWHDLCEDDLILPATGNEYVLKGSELVEGSNSGHFTPDVNLQNLKQLPEPPSARSQDDSSSSTSMSGRDTKTSQDDELSPPIRPSGSSDVSPESRCAKSTPSNSCLSLTEYKMYKTDSLANASTPMMHGDSDLLRVPVSGTRWGRKLLGDGPGTFRRRFRCRGRIRGRFRFTGDFVNPYQGRFLIYLGF